ncbi:glycosyltransferase, partial [Flavobacterium helocola]
AESGTNEDNFDFAQSDKEDNTSLSLRAESRTNENNSDFSQSDKEENNSLSLRAESRTNENNSDFSQSDKEDNTSLSLRAESRTNENNSDFSQFDKEDNTSLSLRAESGTNEDNFDFAQSDKEDNTSLSLRAESRTNENNSDFSQSDKEDNTSLSLRADSGTNENNFGFAQSDKKDNNSLSLRAESRTNENQFKFLFIGTLSKGKQPLYVIQLVEELYKRGKNVILELYGEGSLRKELELYITQNNLESIISLKGNHSRETVLKAYQSSHFLILPSKSEGWPKVVAEAMFWGCVPIASPVSCVSYMMGNGSRGVILQEELNQDVDQIEAVISKQEVYQKMASEGQTWSRQFTTDKFEAEIKKLLRG